MRAMSGRGTATCAATTAGKNLEVQVRLTYLLGLTPGERNSYTFTIHPDGGYSSN